MPQTKIALSGTRPQLDFWADETSAELAFIGPLGCGKTFALAIKEALLRFKNPRCDGLLVVPTYPMATAIHKIEWPAIWAETFGVRVRLIEGEKDCFIWPWGARTWIRSAEKPDRYKGINVSNVTFDEPGQISRIAYDVGAARARHPAAVFRQVTLGGTPEGINWLADLFDVPKPPRRKIFASVWHESMAHYTDQLLSIYGYDQNLLDSYVKGKFVPLREGRAYPRFDRRTHVREVELQRGVPLVLACDFNVDAMRWEVLQFAPHEILVLDEIALGTGASTAEGAREFARRYGGDRRVIVTGDASGQARSTSGQTDYSVLAAELRPVFPDVSFNLPAGNPRVHERVQLVNYYLASELRPVVISPRCSELIVDLERVTWRPGTMDVDKASDFLRTHASDAFGYALWQLARAIPVPSRMAPVESVPFRDEVAMAEF